jgi:hypothetical protein
MVFTHQIQVLITASSFSKNSRRHLHIFTRDSSSSRVMSLSWDSFVLMRDTDLAAALREGSSCGAGGAATDAGTAPEASGRAGARGRVGACPTAAVRARGAAAQFQALAGASTSSWRFAPARSCPSRLSGGRLRPEGGGPPAL